MISIIKAVAKLCVVVAAVATFLRTTPSYAETAYYASNTGSGVSCTLSQPCLLPVAIAQASGASGTGRAICLNAIDAGLLGSNVDIGNQTTEVICPQGAQGFISSSGANQTLRVNGLTLSGESRFTGSGTLILENCAFVDGTAVALDIEPTGPLNLVIKNSRISNNSTVAIILKPSSGGSINATFDHVTVTENGGGGIRLDTTNGPVTADVTDSVITNNTGNGLSAQGGAGGPAMLSINSSVIAKNGAAGVNATGANGAVLVNTTLLDSNASATSVASGGRILTYGNNRIVGNGLTFTGTVPLQ